MEIKLGGKKGGVTIVSEEDYEKVSKYKWFLNHNGYVQGSVNGKICRLNRFIKNVESGKVVDHKDRNKLNNTRENLRILSISQNCENKSKKENANSIYLGVCRIPKGKYRSQVIHNKHAHFLGDYDTEIEAAEKRDLYIVHNKLDHMDLNFPDKKSSYLKIIPSYNVLSKTSKYFGVTKISATQFRASIAVKSKTISILNSPDEILCANAYDNYVVMNQIPDKQLNFPERYNYNLRNTKTLYEVIDDKTIKLIIPTFPDKHVIIDKDDYEMVKYYKCSINPGGYVDVYTGRRNIKRLHRLIMNVIDPNILVDHINGDTFNNTRKNLRISDAKKNAQNKSKSKTRETTSKYMGVSYSSWSKRWSAIITIEYNTVFEESDIHEEFAARRRDIYIIENLADSHFKLNFEWTPEDIIEWKQKLNYKRDNFTSKYLGVHYCEISKKWETIIKCNNKIIFNKSGDSEINVARMRDIYILENPQLVKTKTKLNFKWTPEEIIKWKLKLENTRDPLSEDYFGVNYSKNKKSWIAVIEVNKKSVFRKSNKDKIIIARMRDIFILENLIGIWGKNNTKLNFTWTPSEIQEWKRKLKMQSQYLDVYYDTEEAKWYNTIILDKKQVSTYSNISEEFVARERDLFIMHNLKNKGFKLNFEWDDKTIKLWTNILNYEKQNRLNIKY